MEIFQAACCDLVKKSMKVYCNADVDTDRELDLLWNVLPAQCRQVLESFARGRAHEITHAPALEERLMQSASQLFVPALEPLVRRLCIQLGYVRESDASLLGTNHVI